MYTWERTFEAANVREFCFSISARSVSDFLGRLSDRKKEMDHFRSSYSQVYSLKYVAHVWSSLV